MTHETPALEEQQSGDRITANTASPVAKQNPCEQNATVQLQQDHRIAMRIWMALLLVLLAGLLTACGSLGSNSFSGGGVPIGGSRVFGRVVSAGNFTVSLPNVAVQIQATPTGGETHNLQTTTDKDGAFNFSNVLPGFSNGTLQVTATPSDPAYQSQQIAFSVANGHTEQMIVTLPAASFDTTTAKTIALTLASPAIPGGGSVQLQSVIRDANGKVLPVMPTLVFDGNFGTLDASGTFTVPAGISSGVGTITAYWYRLHPQVQPIRVDNSAPQQPPNPPLLPGQEGPN